MHPKILQFQEFVARKKKILQQLFKLYEAQSDLEDAIVLARLEFQSEETTDVEILLLEIELYNLYQDLGDLDKQIVENQAELEILKMKLNHL